MNSRPSVAIVASYTAVEMTQGKLLGIAPMLQQYGYDPVILTWDPKAVEALRQKPIPFQVIRLGSVEFDRLTEAKKLYPMLDRKLYQTEKSPTWGDLLVFDDYLGCAQCFRVDGLGTWRPDLIITTYGGAESSTPEDEQMNLAISRFAQSNRIPVVALEAQSLDCDLDICRWPADILLRKGATKPKSGTSLKLNPLHSYFTAFHTDLIIEDLLTKEKSLREQLRWEPGIHYLFLPYHLYYQRECFEVMAYLGSQADQLTKRNMQVLVGCGSAFRRGLKEKDMILLGAKRFYEKIPKFHIIEGGQTLAWALISEAMFLPYPNAVLRESCHRYNIPVFERGGESRWNNIELTTTLPEAVAWALETKREERMAA